MSYYLKEKFKISDLLNTNSGPKRVLISVPEPELSGIYSSHFIIEGFSVAECLNVREFASMVLDFQPHILVLGTDERFLEYKIFPLVTQTQKLFPHIPLVTVGYGLPHELLKQLMSAGLVGYVDRRFSRPQDLVSMIKTFLKS